MDLAIRKTTVTGLEDRSWLGSAHGTDSTQTITLDAALFTAGTHYPAGEIRSGTVLAKHSSTGLYGPYVSGGANGMGTARGHLFNTVAVAAGNAHIGAPLLDVGRVIESKLPANHGLDAGAKTALTHIRYA